MVPKTDRKKIRFQLPSSRNHFCEMSESNGGYKITFFNITRKLKTIEISEAQLDRQYLHKISINAGIEFYALTGPYDTADEILRQWHKHFEKKGFLRRLLGK
ncbi:MAG: hypothetical protein ACFE8U_14740 [Candidatus Hermodarchaeota archaeon]